jgi:arginine/lysine/ornithine decarboxylase
MVNKEEQFSTPLFDAMVNLAESRKVSFHTPGHKSGKGISMRFRKFVGPKIFSIDLTTLDEVDSLQNPTGVIKEAQELAAKAYGADRSFFLVNGTSGGNHAMILATVKPKEKIIVARNLHRSVLAGLIMSGAEPIFFDPDVDDKLKVVLNVSYERVKKSIDGNPKAKSLFLTSPNYYGICADLEKIISYAHTRGLTVLVDEAHGPHLNFHPALPISALKAGADLCVQSTHKIIGGMTQASMLHAKRGRIDMDTLADALRFVQSTSPSYILMASLDLARMQMATEGEKLLGNVIRLAEEARERINKIDGFYSFGREEIKTLGMGDMDVTKITVRVSDLGLKGYEASQILNREYDIQVEMADPFNILVIVSIGDRKDDLNRLIEALRDIKEKQAKTKVKKPQPQSIFPSALTLASTLTMTPREAFFSTHKAIPLRDSSGKISSEIVTVYPPGIPILIPGEVITKEIVDYIEKMVSLGAIVDGLEEENSKIRVVD